MITQQSSSDQAILRAENISRTVSIPEGELNILTDISLQVVSGETLAVLGASGSGKSTLLGILAGLDEPSKGNVWFDGVNLNALDEDGRAAIRRDGVGFVFQSFNLIPSLSALENVMVPLELQGKPNPEAQAREFLDRVGLSHRVTHTPNRLSGGEQQRVAMARAFAGSPKLLFADEPTGNLDQKTGHKIIELLLELNQHQQTTLVLVTHDAELAGHCAHRLHLDDGRVVESTC